MELLYTPGGPLETLSLPHGEIQYAYAPTTGHLSAVTTPDGSALRYSYDGFLRTGTTWQGAVTGNVTRMFNTDFQVQALAVNGQAISFGYDADGLLTQAGSLSLTRNEHNGLLTGTALGATATTQTSNAFGELTTDAATIAGASAYAVTYTRDGLGRITEHTETVAGATTTRAYTYDPARRLTTVMENGSPVSHFTYDANGNRVRHNDTTGTYDAQDRLQQYGTTTYTYTGNGEVQTATDTATGQPTLYDYDVLGNLRTVTLPAGTTITYLLDGQQRRIGKQVNGTLVQGLLYQDQLRPIAELDGTGTVVARFVYADHANVPAYIEKGGRTYRLLADHLGSPRRIVDTTDGTIVQRLDYDAFGQVLRDTNPGFQPFGFAGGLYDRNTGLVRFGARDYDPRVGRWTTKDPIRFAAGDTNLYGYVLNDPVNFIDPQGLARDSMSAGLENAMASGDREAVKGFLEEFGKELHGGAKNTQLRNALRELFREKDTIPGGTAGWLRDIIRKGASDSGHLKKALNRVLELQKLLRGDKLVGPDRTLAEAVLRDLEAVIKEYGQACGLP